jgi:hypothetical protein
LERARHNAQKVKAAAQANSSLYGLSLPLISLIQSVNQIVLNDLWIGFLELSATMQIASSTMQNEMAETSI